jgi:3-deoxy-D-manno-octulosonate 8-phosphate phosphatase (KDO 8-P phosphatase)
MSLPEKCKKIKVIVSDVDGVLTDGSLIFDEKGKELKKFNSKDGLICKTLIERGFFLGIITGRKSNVVEKRAKDLGFQLLFQNVSNKYSALEEILNKTGLSLENIAYIGDDTNDLEVIRAVGLSASPSDAFNYIKSEADYVCERKGGEGAFRELADLILKHQDE